MPSDQHIVRIDKNQSAARQPHSFVKFMVERNAIFSSQRKILMMSSEGLSFISPYDPLDKGELIEAKHIQRIFGSENSEKEFVISLRQSADLTYSCSKRSQLLTEAAKFFDSSQTQNYNVLYYPNFLDDLKTEKQGILCILRNCLVICYLEVENEEDLRKL